MHRDILFSALMASMAVACASAGGARGNSCELLRTDSMYVAGEPLFRDCAVDERAELINSRVSPYFSPAGDRSCYSAVIRFVVDSSGTPEQATARVVRTNSSEFADAMLQIIREWRYRPARKNGVPVRQIVQENRAVFLVAAPAGSLPSPPTRPSGC